MADVFLARVAEHEKFRPIGPEYKAVRSDHAEPFGRVFDEVAQVGYASEQRLLGTRVPVNVHIFARTSLQVRIIHRTFPFVRQIPDLGVSKTARRRRGLHSGCRLAFYLNWGKGR